MTKTKKNIVFFLLCFRFKALNKLEKIESSGSQTALFNLTDGAQGAEELSEGAKGEEEPLYSRIGGSADTTDTTTVQIHEMHESPPELPQRNAPLETTV